MANPEDRQATAKPLDDHIGPTSFSKIFTNKNWPDEVSELIDFQFVVAVFQLAYNQPVNWQNQADKQKVASDAYDQAHLVYFNQKMIEMYQTTREQLIDKPPAFFLADRKDNGLIIWQNLLERGHVAFRTNFVFDAQSVLTKTKLEIETGITALQEHEGRQGELYFEGELFCLYNKQNQITGHIGFLIDLTTFKKNEQEAVEKQVIYQLLADYSTDVVWIFNLNQHRFDFISPSVTGLLGYTVEETYGVKAEQMISKADFERVRSEINACKAIFQRHASEPEQVPPAEPSIEIQLISKQGSTIWCELKGRFRLNEQGELELIGSIRNIEKRKKNEQRIIYLSFHDQLTTLYNRHFYVTELRRLDVERNLPMSVLVADVNGLKATNDIYGHTAGDRLLIAVAEVLQDVCRADEIIARVGGDEFVVLLPKTTSSQCSRIVERIQNKIDAMVLAESVLSVSFGHATKKQQSQPFSEIFKNAEDEMYKRKIVDRSLFENKLIQHIKSTFYDHNQMEAQHSKRVAVLCKQWAKYMRFDNLSLARMEKAGRYHDIGKVVIDQAILRKTAPLDEEEWRQLRRHAEIGYVILNYLKDYRDIAEIVLAHHERCDGHGYPKKLKGSSIPLEASMISIVDAYDIMLMYKKMSQDRVVAELRENSGTQFDGQLVESFLNMLKLEEKGRQAN